MPLQNRFNKFILFQIRFASQAELIIVHRGNHLLGSLAKEKLQVHQLHTPKGKVRARSRKISKKLSRKAARPHFLRKASQHNAQTSRWHASNLHKFTHHHIANKNAIMCQCQPPLRQLQESLLQKGFGFVHHMSQRRLTMPLGEIVQVNPLTRS